MTKSDATKKSIVSTAMPLFAEKGYAAITMADVCEACSMSRGGVYRYFGSTKEIFITLLENDMEEGRAAVAKNIVLNVPAFAIFDNYIAQERTAIFSETKGLYYAIHEFVFHEKDMRAYFDKRFQDTVEIISAILRHGQSTGEMKECDAETMAAHIIYFLDSLKTSSIIFTITEEEIDKQLHLIREMLT